MFYDRIKNKKQKTKTCMDFFNQTMKRVCVRVCADICLQQLQMLCAQMIP